MLSRREWRGLRAGLKAGLAGLVLSAGLALAPAPAAGQEGDGFLFSEPRFYLQVRAGGTALLSPRGQNSTGDLFGFTQREFTIGDSDFDLPSFGGDLGVRLTSRLQIMGSFEMGDREFISESRDFEEELADGSRIPITQGNYFYRRNFDLWARYLLTSPGRRISRFAWIPNRIVPFVGAGVGYTNYEFRQNGDFVDLETFEIFTSNLVTTGSTGALLAVAGLQVNLTSRAYLTTDVRYRRASAQVGGDFVGFDDVDLSGFQFNVGLGFFF